MKITNAYHNHLILLTICLILRLPDLMDWWHLIMYVEMSYKYYISWNKNNLMIKHGEHYKIAPNIQKNNGLHN